MRVKRLLGGGLIAAASWAASSNAASTNSCYGKPNCVVRLPSDDITYCWVGDSQKNEKAFSELVRNHMRDFESAAHINFIDANVNGSCPAPRTVNGKEFHDVTLRIMLTARGVALSKAERGPDCKETEGERHKNESGGHFANYPWSLEKYRGCRYNVLLRDSGDRRWAVHHEIGHAVGLLHEFTRSDAVEGWESATGTECKGGNIGGGSIGYVTAYDIDSTTHYDRCGRIVYGLSFYDKLALQALYPEPSQGRSVTVRHRTWLQEKEAPAAYKKAIKGSVAANAALF